MKNRLLALLLSLLAFPAYAGPFTGGTAIQFPPLLDTVQCLSSADAFYGTVKLRSAYGGNAFQMRVKQGGTYAYQDIGFVGSKADYASADAFAATADANTPPEARAYDQCGNGNDSTFVDVSTKGFVWSPYTLGTTGLRTLAFDTLNDNSTTPSKQQLNLPATMAMNMDAYSVVMIGRRGSSYSAQPVSYYEFKNTAPWYSDWYDYSSGGSNMRLSSGTTLNFGTVETGPGVYMNVVASTTASVIANETTTSRSKAVLSAVANNGGTMGSGQVLATYNGGQDVIAMGFFNRTLNSTEQAQVDAYGYGLVGNIPAVPTCLVVIGDSGQQAAFAAYNQNPVNQAVGNVATPVNKPIRVVNAATSGDTASNMLTNISRYTGACAQAGVTRKIALVKTGANDLNQGASVATVEATLTSIWTAMHNAGFKVVCEGMPNSNISNASNLAPTNAWIQANYAANNCDALSDVWADANIGAGSANTNTTYWYTDRIHLAIQGNRITGQLEANAINTLN
jgi:hypothetical protein